MALYTPIALRNQEKVFIWARRLTGVIKFQNLLENQVWRNWLWLSHLVDSVVSRKHKIFLRILLNSSPFRFQRFQEPCMGLLRRFLEYFVSHELPASKSVHASQILSKHFCWGILCSDPSFCYIFCRFFLSWNLSHHSRVEVRRHLGKIFIVFEGQV